MGLAGLFTRRRRAERNDAAIRAGLRKLEYTHKVDPTGALESNLAILRSFGSSEFGGRGGFDGARQDRFTDDWNPGQQHPMSLYRADARTLRDRARDLVRNNPLAKAGVDAYVANVIECGITPKPLFDDADRRARWTAAWDHWTAKEADITRQQHFYELQALWLEEIIVAGGCLTHFVELPRGRNRRLPAAIELIPEERFCDEHDTYVIRHNAQKSSNQVVGGIEIDGATGEAVRYWVKPPDFTGYDGSIEPIKLPAEDCSYAYFKKRIGQYRGDTLLHAAIMWLWKLGYYTDNELMASAVKSCFSAVIKAHDDGGALPAGLLGDSEGASADEYGNQFERLQPAMVARLRPGEDIVGVGPNVPGSDGEAWIVFIERCIGIAIGLSYEELCRDYSKGNFSSTRASANADRKRFRPLQRFTVNHLCTPARERFVDAAVRTGLDGFPRPSAYLGERDEWLATNWRAPGWETVNPLDDARADDIKLKNGSTNLEEIAAQRGRDWEETLEQRGREEDKADELTLRITGSKFDPALAGKATGPADGSADGAEEPSRQTAHDAASPAGGNKGAKQRKGAA